MTAFGVWLIVAGAALLFFSVGMREYGRRDPAPSGTIVDVGEDIRRRHGNEVAGTYYAEASRQRELIAAKWLRVAVTALLLVGAGVGLMLAG